MAGVGSMVRKLRAGEAKLLWNDSRLQAAADLRLAGPELIHGGVMPLAHVARRQGGRNTSPALAWHPAPEGATALLLVMQDVDVPFPAPLTHVAALLEPSLTSLPEGALDKGRATPGVQLLRAGLGRGYEGPAPIRGHGPHRYVIQLFAVVRGGAPDGTLRQVVPQITAVPARGRLDVLFERT